MSHQDDLESNYKVASNEQPSNEIDQLIIQAATDALESNTSQIDATDAHDNNNVIKGLFKLRRWQTPVSIAAAALFTVSFISSYDFWQVNELDFAQDSLESRLLDKSVSEDEIAAPAPPVSLSQEAYNKKDQNKRTENIPDSESEGQMRRLITGSRIARKNKVIASQSATEEKALSTFKLESINTLNDSQSDPEITSVSTQAKENVNLKNKILPLDITKWLDKIEADVGNDKIENAKAEIVILIKQHPLCSFTKFQRDRFDNINKNIQLARSN